MNEWHSAAHALEYLARADRIPHRTEGEAVLLDHLPPSPRRVLDVGTGDGRLLHLVRLARPEAMGIGLDFSPAMLAAARRRFAGDPRIEILEHDLDHPLPDLGRFDAVVSCFAIHHLAHERKRCLYAEVLARLVPGGVFLNLEHVSSPTRALHERFYAAIGESVESEDPSNRLLDIETQIRWLRELGFIDADCHWKWLELALLGGVKPAGHPSEREP